MNKITNTSNGTMRRCKSKHMM